MAMGCYGTKVAIGPFGEPLLPGDSYGELVLRAFDGRVIESTGHPVIQKLLGAV